MGAVLLKVVASPHFPQGKPSTARLGHLSCGARPQEPVFPFDFAANLKYFRYLIKSFVDKQKFLVPNLKLAAQDTRAHF